MNRKWVDLPYRFGNNDLRSPISSFKPWSPIALDGEVLPDTPLLPLPDRLPLADFVIFESVSTRDEALAVPFPFFPPFFFLIASARQLDGGGINFLFLTSDPSLLSAARLVRSRISAISLVLVDWDGSVYTSRSLSSGTALAWRIASWLRIMSSSEGIDSGG